MACSKIRRFLMSENQNSNIWLPTFIIQCLIIIPNIRKYMIMAVCSTYCSAKATKASQHKEKGVKFILTRSQILTYCAAHFATAKGCFHIWQQCLHGYFKGIAAKNSYFLLRRWDWGENWLWKTTFSVILSGLKVVKKHKYRPPWKLSPESVKFYNIHRNAVRDLR